MSLNSGDIYSMEGRNSRSHLSLLFRHGSQDCSFPFRLYFSVKLELELRAEDTLWTPALVTLDMFGWIGTHAGTVTNQEHTRRSSFKLNDSQVTVYGNRRRMDTRRFSLHGPVGVSKE